MPALWTCPRCGRIFRQKNQSHSCGVGSRSQLLKSRPPELVKLYLALEKAVKAFGPVEIVAKQRYILLRTTRIFADVVFMRDALRVALLLKRTADDPMFLKVGKMTPNRIAHVAKIHNSQQLRALKPYIREAYQFARQER